MNDYYIENTERMRTRFLESCKQSKAGPLFGLEHEQFLVDAGTHESIGYFGPNGVEGLLEELRPFYEGTTMSEGHLIGLSRKELAVTIEPAAQFEISVSPQREISEIDRIVRDFYTEIDPILEKRGIILMPTGYLPKSRIDDLPLIPKKRYEYMYRYFKSLNGLGPNMMKGTSSVHFSIDYFCEESFGKKYGIAYALIPIFSFMTENTPVFEGKPYTGHLLRMKIWEETDPSRVEVLKYILEGGMNFKRYIEFLSNAPVIVEQTEEGERYSEETIGSLLTKHLYSDEGLDHLLSMVFPMVRIKSFLEIRAADSMPYPEVKAYMLLIKGIFTDIAETGTFVHRILEKNPDWYQTAVEKITKDGAQAPFAEGTLLTIISGLTELALSHLKGEERNYLALYEDTLKKEGTFLAAH